MKSGLEAGFLLDHLWHQIRGEMEQSKRPTLLALAKVLADATVPYAIIGGVALQIHQAEPRTTLDIDVAVRDRHALPRAAMLASGLRQTGDFPHSQNWVSADGIALQFTDDPALASAIDRADVIQIESMPLRVIRRSDLLHEKLRAGGDPDRRRSKRLQDLADAQALLESNPELARDLSEQEQELLRRLPP